MKAHRVDEYLQATTIVVGKDRVQAEIRLTPGIEVFPVVLATVDTNRDGAISVAEQRAYAARVLRDVSLEVDGHRLTLRLVSSKFAAVEEMQEGRGAIQLDLEAAVPRGGPERTLTFENHHLSKIGVYLVNGLVPTDPDIRYRLQSRNYEQARYQLDYVQTGVAADPSRFSWWTGAIGLFTIAVLLSFARLILFRRRFAHVAT
jgi:hypothetical protein